VEILLEVALDEARQYVPSVMATLDQTAEGLLMRCSIGNLGWFAHFLAGLPFPFSVRQPPELRTELERMAERIAEMARR
jgi:predicted DNA-binding transcriptional regulator YafY